MNTNVRVCSFSQQSEITGIAITYGYETYLLARDYKLSIVDELF